MTRDEIRTVIEGRIHASLLPSDLQTWLTDKVPFKASEYGNEITQPCWETLFWLIICNGGLQVYSWGCISMGGPFQRGLDQESALALMQMSAFVSGYARGCGINIHGPLCDIMIEYRKLVEAGVDEATTS